MTPNFNTPTPLPLFLIAILIFLYEQCTQLLKFKTKKINHVVTVGMCLVCKLFTLRKQYSL